jgi:hypothetical protein
MSYHDLTGPFSIPHPMNGSWYLLYHQEIITGLGWRRQQFRMGRTIPTFRTALEIEKRSACNRLLRILIVDVKKPKTFFSSLKCVRFAVVAKQSVIS